MVPNHPYQSIPLILTNLHCKIWFLPVTFLVEIGQGVLEKKLKLLIFLLEKLTLDGLEQTDDNING